MILIISTCSDPLSELEFVEPVKKIVGNCKIIHISKVTQEDIDKADKIIICGTSLKDFDYLNANVDWVVKTDKPILGICAGMQLIAKAYNIKLVDSPHVGVLPVNIVKENPLFESDFNAYFLHTKTIKDGFDVLATVNGVPAIVKHPEKPHYGVIFHPEVMNEYIIRSFVKLK